MRPTCGIVLLLTVFLPGCGKFSAIQGSGNIVTEKRTVAEFSGIGVSSAIQLDVTVGEKATLEVTADDNLLPHLITEVKDGTLTIRFEGSYSTKHGVKVKAVTPKLTSLQGSGAITSSASGLKESFTLQLSGASRATLTGKIDELTAQCSGASRVVAKDLDADTVTVKASGASTAEVKATKALAADASGASTVLYHGTTSSNTLNSTGASVIKPAP